MTQTKESATEERFQKHLVARLVKDGTYNLRSLTASKQKVIELYFRKSEPRIYETFYLSSRRFNFILKSLSISFKNKIVNDLSKFSDFSD